MSLFEYYKRLPKERILPNPQGPLSRVIPSAAISSANSELAISQEERGSEQTLKMMNIVGGP